MSSYTWSGNTVLPGTPSVYVTVYLFAIFFQVAVYVTSSVTVFAIAGAHPIKV